MRALPPCLLPSSVRNTGWRFTLRSTAAWSLWLLAACAFNGDRAFAQSGGSSSVPTLAITRHALQNNGRIEGSAQQLTGEGVNLNSGAVFTGDFLVPGTPTVQVNASPTWSGQQTGTGSTSPTGYTITVNSGVQMRYLVKRTDPVTLATVATPPSPAGTRQVTISSPSDANNIGSWSTVKDLTLNSGAGSVTVPAGTYGTFNASNSNNTGFVFGTAGATTVSVYNLQALTLNSNSRLTVVGPVVINVAGQVLVNSNTAILGSTSNSGWLKLNDAGAGVTLNSGSVIYGAVNAPAGTINVNGKVAGTATCNQLSVNSGGVITAAVVPNQAPVVSAGSNQTVTLPASVTLSGTVTDDGQPVGATVTSTWSKSSGPGNVTFASASSPQTTASFSAAGTYVLQLSASDTQLSSSATMTVTVNPANQAPIVSAGNNQTISLPANASLSGSVTDDGLPAGASVTSTWTKTSGPGTVTFANAAAPQTTASFSAAGTYVLQLSASDTQLSSNASVTVTVNPANKAPVVSAGAAQTVTLPSDANLAGSVSDDGLPAGAAVTSAWTKTSGPGNVTFGNAGAPQTSATFSAAGTYVLQLSASDTQLSSSATVTITVNAANKAPVVNAGAAQTIALPATASLAGSVTDDGLPTGAQVTSTWSKSSGPGTVGFGNPAAPQTTASFSKEGTYVLQLSASDTQLSSSASVTITVNPQNQPPTVAAGAAQTIRLPAAAALSGTATDDGLPSGSHLTVTWSQVSGPGNTTFSAAAATATAANFSAAGTYVLRLSANDTQLTSTSDVTVTVLPANQAPVVSAGADQTVTLPAVINLAGSVTDDGVPTGATVTSTWSKVSGPGTATFANAATPQTTLSVDRAGTYVLQLSASDTQLSSNATVTVTVKLSNQPPQVSAGPAQAITLPASAPLNGSVTDDGLPQGATVKTTWAKVSGPGIVTFANPASAQTTVGFDQPGTYVLSLTGDDTQFAREAQTTVTVHAANQPPQVNAGPAQSVEIGTALTLNGTATDDGLPRGGGLTVGWSQVGGPGTATFSAPSSAVTSATFSAMGTYTLRLSANDSALTSTSDVQVVVTIKTNKAPVVHAGSTQTLQGNHATQLAGSITDDGLPTPPALTSTWTSVSGPGIVTFANAGDPLTTASFGAAGTYVLQLSASDGQLSASDEVTVNVTAANEAPKVRAGAQQTITLPAVATLRGAATDDGLPLPAALSFAWSQVSGPAAVHFSAAVSAATSASFTQAGDYLLRLSVSDGQLSASDQTTVHVLGACNHPAPPGLTGFWTGDDTIDDLVDSSPAALQGRTVYTAGEVGDAFLLDGGSGGGVLVHGTSGTNIGAAGSGLSAECWVNPVNPAAQQALIEWNNGSYRTHFWINGGTGTLFLHLIGANGGDGILYSPPGIVTAGNWQHVGWTYDKQSGIARLYYNGAVVTEQNVGSFTPATDGDLQFGQRNGSYVFQGGMDEVSIYERALTSTEIQAIYMAATDGKCRFPINHPPTAFAGNNQTLPLSYTATLQGAATDDGLPAGSLLSTTWTQVSGPAPAAFTDASSLTSTVNFPAAGTYVFQLAASDGALSASSKVTFTVLPDDQVVPSTVTISPYRADWRYMVYQYGQVPDAVSSPDFDDTGYPLAPGSFGSGGGCSVQANTQTYWPPSTEIVLRRWVDLPASITNVRVSGTVDNDIEVFINGVNMSGGFIGHEGCAQYDDTRINVVATTVLKPGRNLFVLRGRDRGGESFIDAQLLVDQPIAANAGNNFTVQGGAVAALDGSASTALSGKPLTYQWHLASGPVVPLDLSNPAQPRFVAPHLGAATDCVFKLIVSDGLIVSSPASVTVTVAASAPTGPGGSSANQPPTVSAGNNLSLGNSFATVLQGTAADDGLPTGSTLRTTWSEISGPGTASFADPSALSTTVRFTRTGTYVLQLLASDGELIGASQVTISVGANVNLPPSVSAGVAQRVQLPNVAVLAGRASDDGLPAGSTLTCTWSQVSGPGVTFFANANQLATTATFDQPGAYVLRLSASDGQWVSTSDVNVTVTVPGGNQPPTIAIGAPTRTVPFGQALVVDPQLDDDGLPSGELDFSWAQLDGPASVTFADASGTPGLGYYATSLAFPAAGTYHLRAGASDGALTSNADLSVTVTPGVSQPPVVNLAAAQTNYTHGQPVELTATATDPDGWVQAVDFYADGQAIGRSALPADLVQNPDAPFEPSFTLTWTGAAVGTHTLTAVATDNSGTTAASAPVTITVGPAVPTVALTYPAAYSAFPTNTAVSLQASAQPGDDGSPVAQVSFAVNGQSVGSSGQAPYGVTWTAGAAGDYTLTATAVDAAGQRVTSAPVLVRVVAAGTDPDAPTTVDLAGPTDGQEVTAPIAVTGTVDGPTLASWKLEYRRRSAKCADWTTFAVGTGTVNNAPLGKFDPTLVPNGLYDLRLSAVSGGGHTDASSASVVVDGGMKVGRFTVAFNDLTVPLAGLPITVTRAYDSTEKCPGDFGVGWNLDVSTVKLEKNYALGDAWYADFEPQDPLAIPTYFLQDSGPHVITITFPDGNAYKFQPVLTLADGSPASRWASPISSSEPLKMAFKALPGTQGTLAAIGIPKSLYLSDDAYLSAIQFLDDPYDGNLFSDATGWTFTTQDGRVFTFDAQGKLLQMADRNHNTLTFTHTGIYHSSGRNVQFTRDGQDRITAITDPVGQQLFYAYDAAGNLATFTDRTRAASSYTYDAFHNLKNMIDPRGVTPMRNDYDAAGRLVRSTDAKGQTITYSHNVDGKVEATTDRLGHTTTHRYDERGNVLSTTDALGGVTSFTYDVDNNKLSQTDPLGHTTRFAYDANDLLLQVTDALGHATSFTYNDSAQLLKVIDSLGRSKTYSYDASGRIISSTDALGHSTNSTYDSTGNILSEQDALGNVTTHEYDAAGNLVKTTNPKGNVSTFTYDLNGNRLLQVAGRTLSNGTVETLVVSYVYDANGHCIQSVDPLGNTRQTIYNEIGKPAQVSDALGRLTAYAYDAQGHLLSTTAPDGTTTSQTYDAEGHRLTSADQNGHITTYGYDELNRLVKTTLTDGSTMQSVFDAAGRVTFATDANNNVTTYSYDDAGRRTSFKDSLGHVSTYAYDEAGNQTGFTDTFGHTTTYVYDGQNRRIGTVFADGSTQTTSFDAAGRRVAETDQMGRVTQFGYDALGRLVFVTDNTGQKTSYGYDELGNEISQIDANGHTTTYAYDGLGRRTTRTLPAGQTESMAYDAVGNLGTRRDFNGRVMTFGYDAANRLLTRMPDPSLGETTVSFTYSPTGQRLTMTDASGTTTYAYDNRDRLMSKTTPEGILRYTYDAAGHVLTIASSNTNGTSVGYGYDALGRLSAVNDAHTGQTNYVYDNVGNLAGYQFPNGVSTSYGYNALNRLSGLNVTALVGGTTRPLASFGYTLDLGGQRTGVAELGGRKVVYGYDSLGRLQSEQISGATGGSPNGQVTYRLDAVGNRLQRTSTLAGVPSASASYDADDRLGSDNYDANGNTRQSGGSVSTDAYDSFDRLVARTDGSTGVRVVYDGDGHKVQETSAGVTTSYLIDEANPTGYAQAVEELTNGVVSRVYTWGTQLISQDQYAAASARWSATFYGYDGQGSVRLLTDQTGTVTDRYDYDAFGNLLLKQGSTSNHHLYCGEELDQALGLYNLRARLMNPLTGRFWNMDSFPGKNDDPRSIHKYLYAYDDGVNITDPSGNAPWLNLLPSWAYRLAANISPEAALYIYMGYATHIEIGEAYQIDHPYGGVHINRWLSTILPSVDFPNPALRPDIVDDRTKEVYEIKSAINETIDEAINTALKQALKYIDLLNEAPDAGEENGPVDGRGYVRGISWPPTPRTVPGEVFPITYWRAAPGVILYQNNSDLAEVLLALVTRGPALVAKANAAEIEEEIGGISVLSSLMISF